MASKNMDEPNPRASSIESDRISSDSPSKISIVVPVFNEEGSLLELHRRISDVMESIETPFELVLVNDGSSDGSLPVLVSLCSADRRVRVLDFSRNFGHQYAIAAGLDNASGSAVVTMDGDLQHPPEMIPQLIDKWMEGYDVVYTCRRRTAGAGPIKNATSRFFYRLINRMSDVTIPPGAADFRLMDRSVVDEFKTLSERSLFLRGLISWMGYRQAALDYEAEPRFAGSSKYSVRRMLRFAVDGLTSFSTVPLHMSVYLGVFVSMLSFLYAAYAVYSRLFTDRVVEGWTSAVAAVLLLGGIQLIVIGIQGIYLGRVYNEVRRRPRYLVRRRYGF